MKISCVRWRHVLPFMKALPISFSDQPYLPGKHKGKRTIYTETPLLKRGKAQKEPLQISKPPSTEVEKPKTLAALPTKTDPQPAPSAEINPLEDALLALPVIVTPTKQKAESSKDRDTPVSDRLFGDSISDSEEDEDTLRSPDISIHEPPVTSTPKRLVTSETVREYDVVDKAAQTDTYIAIPHGSRSRRTVIRDI